MLTTVEPIIFSQFSQGMFRVDFGIEDQIFQKLSENIMQKDDRTFGAPEVPLPGESQPYVARHTPSLFKGGAGLPSTA